MATAHGFEDVTAEELAAARGYAMEITWSPEDAAFLASFPDVPGVVTHGTTREEAAAMGDEVIVAWYTAMKDAGQPIPRPAVTVREAKVRPPDPAVAEAIRQIRADLNVSQRIFAALLNVNVGTVRSWEQGWRTPDGATLRLIEIAKQHPRALLDALPPTVDAAPDPEDQRHSA